MLQEIKNIYSRLINLIKTGKLISVDDSGNLRSGVVSFLGKNQKVNVFTPYGLMHNPPINSLSFLCCLLGKESNILSFSDDPINRPLKNLKEGEVALGNYKTGDYVYFDEDGNFKGVVTKDFNFIIGNDQIESVGNDKTVTAGNDINLTATNNINLTATTSISLNAPQINITGALTMIGGIGMTGTLNITGDLIVNGKSINQLHKHPIISGSSAPGPTGGVS